MTSYDLYQELGIATHKNLMRTLSRLYDNGLHDEMVKCAFTNKMNRTYDMYDVSERVVNMIECIYLFSGKKESELIKENSINNTGVVYFVHDGVKMKIGYTTNLKTRLSALQVANSRFVEVIATIETDRKNLELELHNHFSDNHISGEWFNIGLEILPYLKKKYKRLYTYDTLGNGLLELWHDSPEGTNELSISDFTDSTNYRILRKLRNSIWYAIDSKMSYSDSVNYAKEEVNQLADSLNFKKKLK